MMTRRPIYVATVRYYTECKEPIRAFDKEADAKAFEDAFDACMRIWNTGRLTHAQAFRAFVAAYPWVVDPNLLSNIDLDDWQNIEIDCVQLQP